MEALALQSEDLSKKERRRTLTKKSREEFFPHEDLMSKLISFAEFEAFPMRIFARNFWYSWVTHEYSWGNSWGISFHGGNWPTFFTRNSVFHEDLMRILTSILHEESVFTRTSWACSLGFEKSLMMSSWKSGPISSWKNIRWLLMSPHEETHESSWGNSWVLMRKLMSPHEETHESSWGNSRRPKFSKKTLNELLAHTQTSHLSFVKLSWTHFCLMRDFTLNKLNSKWGISITNTCTVEIK